MEGGGGADPLGDDRAQLEAAAPGASNDGDTRALLGLVSLPLMGADAHARSANIAPTADRSGHGTGRDNGGEQQQGGGTEGCAVMEISGMPSPAALDAELAVSAPHFPLPPRRPLPQSRQSVLESIPSAQIASVTAEEVAAGVKDAAMDDGSAQEDESMAGFGRAAPQGVAKSQETDSMEEAGAGAEMEQAAAGVNAEGPVAAAADKKAQGEASAGHSSTSGTTAPSWWGAYEKKRVEGLEMMSEQPVDDQDALQQSSSALGTSAVSSSVPCTDATPAQSGPQEQAAAGASEAQAPAVLSIKAASSALASDSNPTSTSVQVGRSTRSSRRKPSRYEEVQTAGPPVSSHSIVADLTLETVSGSGDAPITGKTSSKKRSQQAVKTASAAPARATKRSRTREKKRAGAAEDDDQEDDVLFVKQQPPSKPPPRARARKRPPTTEEPVLAEAAPIIMDVPPLPFSTQSSRRQASHSASPSRGAPMDRECEFCNHTVDMCTLLICKACRRAYHVRCLIRQFKKYWPDSGSVQERLKKLQATVSDRRASLFRCTSCRAVFAEFVDTPDKYLSACTCPTCTNPQLLATFRRNKLFEMLLIMNEAKLTGKQGAASKRSTASVTSDASADSGSSEAAKKSVRSSREPSADRRADGASTVHGGAARRKSSRPARRGVGRYNDNGTASEIGTEGMSTGFAASEMPSTKAPAAEASVPEHDATPLNAEASVAMGDAARALTELSLAADAEMRQSAPVAVAATSSQTAGPTSASTKEGELMDKLLSLIDVSTAKGKVLFPVVCVSQRLDHQAMGLFSEGDARSVSMSKLQKSVLGRGRASWSPGKFTVLCSCCNKSMMSNVFETHFGLTDSKNSSAYIVVVHRDKATGTPANRFLRAVRWKLKIHKSFATAFSSGASVSEAAPVKTQATDTELELAEDVLRMAIPRKKDAAATAAPKEDTTRRQSAPADDLLNDINADAERTIKQDAGEEEMTAAFQRVSEVMLVKRNHRSKISLALRDEPNAEPMDFLVKVVSVDREYLAQNIDGTTRDRMSEVPQAAASRRVGWLALSASRRFSTSIYCECCERALPVRAFMAHSDLKRKGGSNMVLNVMERVLPSRVQSFTNFCQDAALIVHSGGDQAFATVLAGLQEFPASPSEPTAP